jgi:DNA invertase Pin-like site-specific DNA recombinase
MLYMKCPLPWRTSVKLDRLFSECAVVPSPDSTLGAGLESMKGMTKAALYARVSADKQRVEGTIESQVAELKRQVAAGGHVLVKEYIDDGYTGAEMDRPGLEQLRKDVKTDIFDTIYFLCADRIAREVAYQTIIVDELLKHGKQVIINAKDYVRNPENKLTLTMLGAFAEFERAKIIERTMRSTLHRLRQGQITSQGHCIYGYEYVRKSPHSPPALVINEQEAVIVRSIFETYIEGTAGPDRIARALEEIGIPTRKGKKLWRASQIKSILPLLQPDDHGERRTGRKAKVQARHARLSRPLGMDWGEGAGDRRPRGVRQGAGAPTSQRGALPPARRSPPAERPHRVRGVWLWVLVVPPVRHEKANHRQAPHPPQGGVQV